MAITIKKVSSKKELKTFIRFNYELYKENPYSVPDLYDDMLNTFSPKKNAAFEFCEAEYFLAYKDNKVPRPPAPIKAANVAVPIMSTRAVRIPAMICGKAIGSSTLNNLRIRDIPNASAASSIDASISEIPK